MYQVQFDVVSEKLSIRCNTIESYREVGDAHILVQALVSQQSDGTHCLNKSLLLVSSPRNIGTPFEPRQVPQIVWSSVEQFVDFFIRVHEEKLADVNLQPLSRAVEYTTIEKDRQIVKSSLYVLENYFSASGVLSPVLRSK